MSSLVSIITPMFNNADVVQQAINSVMHQNYTDWELILIDDASTDHTIELLKPVVDSNPRIKLLQHNTNKGAAIARNYGTKEAKGNYIAFLDADDLWKPNKLEHQLAILQSEADICFGSYELIDAEGNLSNLKVNALNQLNYKKQLRANYIGNLTGIYNCKSLGKIYTKDLRKRQDWLLWLEALERSKRPAIGIQDTLAYYRVNESSLSSNKIELLKHNYNVYRKGLEFSFLKSLRFMSIFLYEHLFVKRKLIKPTD